MGLEATRPDCWAGRAAHEIKENRQVIVVNATRNDGDTIPLPANFRDVEPS